MGLASSVGILRRSAPLGGATRTELQINQEDLWRHWSSNSDIILTLMVEMLFRCHLSPEQILNQDRDSTEGSYHDSRGLRGQNFRPPRDDN